MKLRRKKAEEGPPIFGYELPAVEAERRWPATTISGRMASPERVKVSAPTRWGHDPIESALPDIVQRPIGTEFDEDLE